MNQKPYRGRIAPSPTGYLHVGHARTFWTAGQRAAERGGTLVLRNEDLDRARCRAEFVDAMFENLRWFGLDWQEGPDVGGAFGPYNQSERMEQYRAALRELLERKLIYPCACSRKDIQAAAGAPHAGDDEVIYPGTCRPGGRKHRTSNIEYRTLNTNPPSDGAGPDRGKETISSHWRFRVPDGEIISFIDGNLGRQQFVAGTDFGDFVVWRNDDVPAYQLACVVDDAAMRITEVVRGEDLLRSTARQLLLYRALDLDAPEFFHCPLVCDEQGQRLAKRHDALSLRRLRESGAKPESLRG